MLIMLWQTELLVLFDWSVTSDSGIFQLVSDGMGLSTQFQKLDLLGTHVMGSYDSFTCRAYPDTDTATSEDIFEGWTGRYTTPLALTS